MGGIPPREEREWGPQPGSRAPLPRLQAQGARAGLRGSGARGGQAEREGRRRAGQKVCRRPLWGHRPGDALLALQRPQHAWVSCSPWVSRDQTLPARESPRSHQCAPLRPLLHPLTRYRPLGRAASPAHQALPGAWEGTWANFLPSSFLPR